MLRSIKHLRGYSILAKDGELGNVKDFFFDDQAWAVQYLVVDTGGWLTGRKVLIPRIMLGQPDWAAHSFPVKLTKKQIEDCPPIDEHEPVSRQHEVALHNHFGIEAYWARLPGGSYPVAVPPDTAKTTKQKEGGREGDPNLRSAGEVFGYDIEAVDGEIGKADDFIVEDDSWLIRYLVVDTHKWLPGRKVLVAVPWTKEVSWSEAKLSVDLTREKIRNSPDFDPNQPVNRKYEEVLYDYYGSPRYWS